MDCPRGETIVPLPALQALCSSVDDYTTGLKWWWCGHIWRKNTISSMSSLLFIHVSRRERTITRIQQLNTRLGPCLHSSFVRWTLLQFSNVHESVEWSQRVMNEVLYIPRNRCAMYHLTLPFYNFILHMVCSLTSQTLGRNSFNLQLLKL